MFAHFLGSDNKSCYCVRKRAAHWLVLLSRDAGMTAARNTCRSVTISMVDTLVQVSAAAISSLAAVPARHGGNVAEVARRNMAALTRAVASVYHMTIVDHRELHAASHVGTASSDV